MATSWNKKERENKKRQERQQKQEKKQMRKDNAEKGKQLNDMMAYLDENGNLTSEPPDPRKKITFKIEEIEIGVPKQKELSPEELLRKGVISFFNSQKGFGFIEDSQTGQRIFVHQSSSEKPLQEGLKVIFEVEKGPRGLTAINVSSNDN